MQIEYRQFTDLLNQAWNDGYAQGAREAYDKSHAEHAAKVDRAVNQAVASKSLGGITGQADLQTEAQQWLKSVQGAPNQANKY